ncbi:MAG: hypothetical protein CL569_00530 [Alphaproteobacteria bacterium]|nr:hypothetical protein [Alphaproteobacteria bacterium]
MTDLNERSATAVVAAITSNDCTAEEVTRACLARIEEREPEIGAFEYLDPTYAIEQARVLDAGPVRGALHGVPIGIKDCFETFDMPTTFGSEIYAGNNTGRDAAIITLLRNAGAVILGKTVTSEFIAFWPGKTRNPHNTAHTTGVSSMGSAAGVADMMMPIGLATQSGGSTVRPAAHCGIIGYKSSHGEMPTDGLMPMQASTDTVGFVVRHMADAALMRKALLGAEPAPPRPADAPPRIALIRTSHWEEADPVTHTVIENVSNGLRGAGAIVEEPAMASRLDNFTDVAITIQQFEFAHWRAYEWEHYRERISEPLRDFMAEGHKTSFAAYNQAQIDAAATRVEFDALFDTYDLVLTPSAVGEALKLGYPTGSSNFNRMWSLLHSPGINLPAGTGPQGLPIGVQLIGRKYHDDQFLADAAWVLDRIE